MVPTRVYVSVPGTSRLAPQDQQMKTDFLDLLKRSGMEPQEFPVSGLAAQSPWTFEKVNEVIARRQGVIILGLPRGQIYTPPDTFNAPTSYNHCEGALALAHNLPTLIITEPSIEPRGIFDPKAGNFLLYTKPTLGTQWLNTRDFQDAYKAWCKKVRSRFHIFFGYCAKARPIAQGLI